MGQMNWAQYAEEAAKSGGFEPLPTGTYNVRVETADLKDGKNEHKQILTKLIVTDGPLAGRSILNNMAPYKNDGDPNGFFTSHLAALGFGRETNPAFWQQLGAMPTEEQGMQLIANSVVGCEATIEVNQRTHGGILRDNVRKMSPKGAAIGGVPVVAAGAVPQAAPVAPAPAAPVPVAQPAAVPAAQPAAVPAVAAPVEQTIAPAPVAATPAPVAAAPVAEASAAPAPVAVPPVAAAVPVVTDPIEVAPAAMIRPDEAPF